MGMISNYKIFKIIAILLGIIIFIWLIADFIKELKNVNNKYVEANNSFLKKKYHKALNLYKQVSEEEPNNLYALEGQARSLMRMQKYTEAEKTFKIVLKKNKMFLPALTNIAILYDTVGEYDRAVYFYKQAMQQDSRVKKRMSWLKRFLKNIHFKPSTIEERLLYLERQLSLKNNKRKLNNEQIDNLQPDYQM